MGTKIIDGILEVTKSGTSNNSVVRKEELQNVIELAEGRTNTYILSYGDTIDLCKQKCQEQFFVYNYSTKTWENKYQELLTGTYDSYAIINSTFNSTNDCLMEAGDNYLIVRCISNELAGPSSNPTSHNTPRYLLSLSWRDLENFLPKVGDIFLVTETDVPDRWFGGGATPYHFHKLETTKVDLAADNQTVKTGSVTFGANDVVEFVAGTNVSISGDATNKQITISATDTKVTQNKVTTEDTNLPILLAMNNSGAAQTGTVKKTDALRYNPSTKELKIDGVKVSLEGHNHDDRYYTESEIDTKLASLGGSSNEVLETFKVYDENYGYITLSFGQDALDDEGTIKLDSPSGHTTYGVSSIIRKSDYDNKTYSYGFPSKNGTIALTNDIQTNTWRPIGTGANDAAAGNHNHDGKYMAAAQTEALIVSNSGAILSDNSAKTIGTIAGTALTCQLGSAITISGQMTAGSFYASSDLKLKENIKDYIPKNSILDLPIVEFDFKDSKSHQIGCIAQDLQNLFPELVNTNENGYLTIAENKLVYLCILEIKKLKAELEALKISKE